MKNILKNIKENKLFTTLLIITILSILLGILFPAILTTDNKELIKTSITDYFTAIDNNKIEYIKSLITILSNNIFVTISIWLLGISIIGIIIIIIEVFIKGFIVGFSFTSILVTYEIKGILIGIIYTISNILSLLVTFLLSYYAISFSIMIYKTIFKKKNYPKEIIVKRYIKIGLLALLSSIVISLIEVFIIPKVLMFL